jgi:hypothetical protein
MTKRHLLVSLAVALICSGILVVFTDLEGSLRGWLVCGHLGPSRHGRCH